MNAANSVSYDWLLSQGLTTLHPSWDLNSTQLFDLLENIDGERLELTLHQYMPAFHSEYCAFARALTTGRRFPECGKIYIIKDGVPEDPKKVLELYRKTKPLKARDLESTGWLLDVLKCVEKIGTSTFTLSQLYVFESDLKKKHPENRHIKDKIRQQLQELRDKGFIEFKGRGKYRTLF